MASTNKTTHYELSQYVGSDKPTYLSDYNGDMLKIDTAINTAKTTADTAQTAATTAQTTAEGAQTTATTAVTNAATAQTAANTAITNVGTLANLETAVKTSAVAAINEVVGNVGNLSSLTTTAKSNLVAAINEIESKEEGVVGTILWTNPTPNSSFSTQDISLSSNDYDVLEIFFKDEPSARIIKGYSTTISHSDGYAGSTLRVKYRSVTRNSDTSFNISDCTSYTQSGATTNWSYENADMIPLYVVGHKYNLFN